VTRLSPARPWASAWSVCGLALALASCRATPPAGGEAQRPTTGWIVVAAGEEAEQRAYDSLRDLPDRLRAAALDPGRIALVVVDSASPRGDRPAAAIDAAIARGERLDAAHAAFVGGVTRPDALPQLEDDGPEARLLAAAIATGTAGALDPSTAWLDVPREVVAATPPFAFVYPTDAQLDAVAQEVVTRMVAPRIGPALPGTAMMSAKMRREFAAMLRQTRNVRLGQAIVRSLELDPEVDAERIGLCFDLVADEESAALAGTVVDPETGRRVDLAKAARDAQDRLAVPENRSAPILAWAPDDADRADVAAVGFAVVIDVVGGESETEVVRRDDDAEDGCARLTFAPRDPLAPTWGELDRLAQAVDDALLGAAGAAPRSPQGRTIVAARTRAEAARTAIEICRRPYGIREADLPAVWQSYGMAGTALPAPTTLVR
jgi:hypothetical protein